MSGNRILERTVILTLGRLVSLFFSFVIPYYLSRHLTVEGYGTYKQIFLIFGYAQIVLNLGMDWTIFYFIKRHPRDLPLFSLNIVLVNLAVTLAFLLILVLGKGTFAGLINNPDIEQHLPWLGLLLVFAIPSGQFEDLFLAVDKIKYKVIIDILTEIFKAVSILGGYYFSMSLTTVLYGLITFFLVKLLALLAFNFYLLKRDSIALSGLWPYLKEQLSYSLPVGFSNSIQIILDLDKILMSALFSVQRFTFYVVGCFDIPLIPSIRSNLWCLMNIDMVDAHKKNDHRAIVDLWHDITRKLFFIQIPIGIYMIVFSHPIITLIYSDKFAGSSVYFQVYNLILILAVFSPNTVFLVYAKNRQHLIIQIFSLFLNLALVLVGAYLMGPLAALTGKFLASLISNAVKLHFASRYMGLTWRNLFLWNQLSGVTLVSVLSVTVAILCVKWLALPKLMLLALSFGLFVILVISFSCMFKLINKEEMDYLKSWLGKIPLVRPVS